MDDSDARDLLLSSRFADLPEPLARELVKRGQRRSYPKGRYIHAKGAPGDGLYRLLSGKVRVSALGADGRELVLTDLEPGSFFGEVSLFDGLPRTHDAYALERSELLFVEKQALDALLDTYPELARHFLRALALKVRISLAALDGIALRSVAARLAMRVFVLAKRSATSKAPPEVMTSQTDLARMVGATRQSINKELKAWERAGVIRLEGRKLLVVDEPALLRIANE